MNNSNGRGGNFPPLQGEIMDNQIKDTLVGFSTEWEECRKIEEELEKERFQVLRDFEKEHEETRERIQRAKNQFESLRTKLQEYLHLQTSTTGRKKYFDGLITTQTRKRAGEYDPVALREWAIKHPRTLGVPKGKKEKEEFLSRARVSLIEWMEVDTKAAVKLAIETSSEGEKIFPDSPVEVEQYTTQISAEKLSKVLTTLSIGKDWDSDGRSDSASDYL